MNDDGLPRVMCDHCRMLIRVRYYPEPGVRFRCPMCLTELRFDASPPRADSPPSWDPSQPGRQWVEPAMAARQSYRQSDPPEPPATAVFGRHQLDVFDALGFAVRRAGGDVTEMDRPNRRLAFTADDGSRHRAAVYGMSAGGSEVEIRPTGGSSPGGNLYRRVGELMMAYLNDFDGPPLAKAKPVRERRQQHRLPPARRGEPPETETMAIGG